MYIKSLFLLNIVFQSLFGDNRNSKTPIMITYIVYNILYTGDRKGRDVDMYETFIAKRLSQLREAKGVSAREMSLDIGQNPSYINRIENGKNLPSMLGLFYICEYLQITPEEFFEQDVANPILLKEVIKEMKRLSPEQLTIIRSIIADIRRLNK